MYVYVAQLHVKFPARLQYPTKQRPSSHIFGAIILRHLQLFIAKILLKSSVTFWGYRVTW